MRPQPVIPPEETLAAVLGLEVLTIEHGAVSGRMAVQNSIMQPFGVVHGGVYAVIGESLASLGTFHAVGEQGKVALGMSNNTSFLRAISAGFLNASATALHQGRTTWVWDTSIYDDMERLCAVSRVTIAVREPRS